MGLGIAEAAVEAGAHVIMGGRNEEKLRHSAEPFGDRVTIQRIDTADEASVKAFFDSAGPIDHLTTPGSSVRTGPFRETSLEDIRFSTESKFFGQLLCAKYAQIREGGSIVFFTGILAQRPGNSALLGSINAAVETLAKGLAIEMAPIRVNVVSPGMTAGTEAYAKSSPPAPWAHLKTWRARPSI